jgi:hypothetical protein
MRSTYLFSAARIASLRPRQRIAELAGTQFERLALLVAAACCALVLAGCGSVQVSSAPGSAPAGTSGGVSVANAQPPVINGAPTTSAEAGVQYDYTPNVSDPLGNALSYDITNMPAWASFNSATGELKGTPAADDVGSTAEIEIVVSDGAAFTTIGPFRITITAAQSSPPPVQAPPVISGVPAASVAAGQAYVFVPTASDPNGHTLTFSIVNRPSWASFSTTTGQLSGTPTASNIGGFANILISVSNGSATVSLPVFTLTVTAAPAEGALTISGTPATSANVGAAYSFTPTASDPSGLALTFAVQNPPSWASFNKNTGELSGTPVASNVGTFANIIISAGDGTASAALAAFTITVAAGPADGPPTISGTPATAVTAGTAYSFTPAATDPQGHVLTFSIQNQPSWASFNANTGELAGTPAAANVGSFANIVISVSNGAASATLPVFTITVSAGPIDGPPTIGGTPATAVTAGSAYSFTPTATDPQGHALTFAIQNQPSWATFHATTGQLAGTPSAANVGTFANIKISVSNGTASASLAAFTITVSAQPVDGPPTISGTPATAVTAGFAYSFTPTATDPEGHALTFTVVNRPAWATFNANTGQLAGTPGTGNIGTFANITISVSNGTSAASLPAFTITVSAPVDGPPTISGTPAASVNVGSVYSFTPTATDPLGHALTFSIQNQPSWTTFNKNTGQLSGTPSAANVGTFANITISVTNGTASASLPAFGISVTGVSTGTADLDWTTPTLNTDGTPLVNLAGYRIYYGTASANLNQTVQINNPNINTYVLNNLAAGTWYFAILDYTSDGTESAMSNIASKTIQ